MKWLISVLFLSACTVVERQPPAYAPPPPPPAEQPPPVVPEPTPPPYAPPRVITGFSPPQAQPGARLVVVGENFGPVDVVVLEQQGVIPEEQKLAMPIMRRGAGFIEVQVPKDARAGGYLIVEGPGRAPARSRSMFQLLRMAPPLVVAPRVTSFAPQNGPLGTTIRLWGENFLPGDRVAVGGVILPTTVVTSQLMQAVVVAPSQGGPVEVRRGEMAAAAPGFFRVVEPAPQIQSFAPSAGKPGTTVYVTGQHFAASDVLLLGDLQLPVLARSATQIVVTIPGGARSARFVLSGPGHPPIESAQAFTVETIAVPPPPPPPQITSFSPQAGPIGSDVHLYGQFEQYDEVLLGNLQLPITARWPQQIVVRIPEGAYSDVFHVVRKGSPIATSASVFRVLGADAPVLSRVDPLWSQPGATVHLYGQRLQMVEQVLLAGQNCPIIARSEALLDVQVPNVPGGYFTLRSRGHQDVTAHDYFTVRRSAPPLVGPPQIIDVMPRKATVGQRVQVLGENFTPKDEVWFNGRRVQVVESLPQRITFVVPQDARSDVVLIRRGTYTTSSPELQILPAY